MEQRRAAFVRQKAITPLYQVHDHRVQRPPHVREPVFLAAGPLLIGRFFQHALVDQLAQPVTEDVPGDAQAFLEMVEAADPEKTVAQHHQRPAIADHGQGAGQ